MDIPPLFLPQEIIVPQSVQQVEENEQHNRDDSLPPENIAIENVVEPPQPTPLRRSQRERRPAITDDQGTKFLRNWPIFRRKIGNRPAWKGNSNGKIEWEKIGEKSLKNRKGAILPAAVGPCCAREELARRDR